MSDSSIGTAERRGWREYARGLVIALAAGLFMAYSGAFGTGEVPLLRRLVYWLTLMAIGTVWGHTAARLVLGREQLDGRPWLQAGILTLVIAAPAVPIVWLTTAVAFGQPLQAARLPYYAAPVLLVAAAMTGINILAGGRLRETRAAAPDAGPPRFYERLPLKLKGAEIFAVEAEDHYLRVHTDRGSDLILMRLSDAVSELEGLEGAQTHRSWWVARSAVLDATRGDGRATLTLRTGVQAPVSRTYARALRERGWY